MRLLWLWIAILHLAWSNRRCARHISAGSRTAHCSRAISRSLRSGSGHRLAPSCSSRCRAKDIGESGISLSGSVGTAKGATLLRRLRVLLVLRHCCCFCAVKCPLLRSESTPPLCLLDMQACGRDHRPVCGLWWWPDPRYPDQNRGSAGEPGASSADCTAVVRCGEDGNVKVCLWRWCSNDPLAKRRLIEV